MMPLLNTGRLPGVTSQLGHLPLVQHTNLLVKTGHFNANNKFPLHKSQVVIILTFVFSEPKRTVHMVGGWGTGLCGDQSC